MLPVSVAEVLNNAFKECRQTSGDTMNVYISRTYASAHTGGKKINFGSNWHDATIKEYYLLGDGEERVEGRNYWAPDSSGNPVEI